MKTGTVALLLKCPPSRSEEAQLLEALSDEREIQLVEAALLAGEIEPMRVIRDFREREQLEDENFGNYVEDLLSKPFLRREVQEHAVQWFKSKIRIENFQKEEEEALRVIAQYALKLFVQNPERLDYLLAAPKAQVRVRIFVIEEKLSLPRAS
jgi:hypothetical protein